MKRRTFYQALLGAAICPVIALAKAEIALPAIAAPSLPSRLVVEETVWRALLRNHVGVVERRYYDGQPKVFLFKTLAERERAWREMPPQIGAPGQIEIFEVPPER